MLLIQFDPSRLESSQSRLAILSFCIGLIQNLNSPSGAQFCSLLDQTSFHLKKNLTLLRKCSLLRENSFSLVKSSITKIPPHKFLHTPHFGLPSNNFPIPFSFWGKQDLLRLRTQLEIWYYSNFLFNGILGKMVFRASVTETVYT